MLTCFTQKYSPILIGIKHWYKYYKYCNIDLKVRNHVFVVICICISVTNYSLMVSMSIRLSLNCLGVQ